jgi:hypothetical protein
MATVSTNDNGVAKVIENLTGAMGRRKTAALVICKQYALLAKKTLQDSQGMEQGEGQFWTNRTRLAVRSVHGFVVDDKSNDQIGFGLAHHVEYGKYLELAHNRKHAALEKTIKVLVPFFMDEIKKVFGD